MRGNDGERRRGKMCSQNLGNFRGGKARDIARIVIIPPRPSRASARTAR